MPKKGGCVPAFQLSFLLFGMVPFYFSQPALVRLQRCSVQGWGEEAWHGHCSTMPVV